MAEERSEGATTEGHRCGSNPEKLDAKCGRDGHY
jgi:hypothetical protein